MIYGMSDDDERRCLIILLSNQRNIITFLICIFDRCTVQINFHFLTKATKLMSEIINVFHYLYSVRKGIYNL